MNGIRYATRLNSSEVKPTNDHKARKETNPEATYQKPISGLKQLLKNIKMTIAKQSTYLSGIDFRIHGAHYVVSHAADWTYVHS